METKETPRATDVAPNKKLGFTAIFISATAMGLVGTFGRLAT